MKTLALAFAISLSLIISGCVTVPTSDIEIETGADPKANFKAYKTYAWLGSAQILNDPQGTWEPPGFDADEIITAVIDRELTKRGKVETESYPDLLVAYALGVDMATIKIKKDKAANVEVLENVPSGALAVLLIDPDTEFVVWAGVAVAEIQNHGDEIAKKRLNYALTQMFKELPR